MKGLILALVLAAAGCGPAPTPSLDARDREACAQAPHVVAKLYSDNGDERSGLVKEGVGNGAKPVDEVGIYLIGWQLISEDKLVSALQRMQEIAPTAYARLCADALRR
jgi:hypothetical protein